MSDKENYAVSGYAIVSSSGKYIANKVKMKVVFKKVPKELNTPSFRGALQMQQSNPVKNKWIAWFLLHKNK